MVVVNEEEVVVIAADLLGGLHAGVELDVVPVREDLEADGQHLALYVGRERELSAHALLLGH